MVLEKGCMVLCPPSSPRCKYRASRPEFPLRSCGVQISGEVAWPGRHKLHEKQEMLWSTFVTDTSADFLTILATGLQGSDPNFNHGLSRNVVPSLCPHDLVKQCLCTSFVCPGRRQRWSPSCARRLSRRGQCVRPAMLRSALAFFLLMRREGLAELKGSGLTMSK